MKSENGIQYFGMWKVNGLKGQNRKLPGVLVYDNERRTIVLKVQLYYPLGTERILDWPRVRDLGIIKGSVGTDGEMVLVGCRPLRLGGGRARGGNVHELEISIRYVFRDYKCGRGNSIKLKNVSVDFGEILGWTRTSAYQVERTSKPRFFSGRIWKSVEFGYKFPLPSGGDVSFTPYASCPGDVLVTKTISFTQGVRTNFRYKSSQPWDKIRDDLSLIRNLVEFATTGVVGIEEGSFSQARDKWSRKAFEPKDYEQILFGDHVVGRTADAYDLNYVFTLPELMAVIAKHPKTWRKRFGDLSLALRLYDEIVRMDADRQDVIFVALVQLLEHLHSLVYSDKANAYFARMRDVWGDDEKQVEEKKRRMCGTRDPGKPNLKMRIYEMTRVKGSWLVDNPIGDDGIVFAESVANTRHYFTHHNIVDRAKAMTPEKVEDVSRFLRSLVRFYILKKLGFSEKFALRRMGWSDENMHELFSLKHRPIGEEKIDV